MERTPYSSWQVKVRLLVGTGTFFDAFDALTISQVLPVLTAMWGLSSGQSAWLISIGYLGQLVGALVFAQISERYGRLPGLVSSVLVFVAFSLACAFAGGYSQFLVFRFLQGLGLGGEVPIGAVYINEITKARGRGRFVLLFELIFSVGVVVNGLIGRWVVPHIGWHWMYLIGTLPILIVWPILHWLPESPRWLAGHGRYEQADGAMARMESGVRNALHRDLPAPQAVVDQVQEERGSFSELVRRPYLGRTLSVWVIWIATYLVYYGLGTWLPSLYSSHFHLPLETALTYGLIGNVGAFVGAAICAFTIDYFGRKPIFVSSLLLSALMLCILAALGARSATQLAIFGSLAWLFAGANSIGLYVYTPEIYPTRIRSIGTGTATSWMRLASMAGPLIVGGLISHGLPLILVLFAAVAIVGAGIVARFSVETKGRVLEEISE